MSAVFSRMAFNRTYFLRERVWHLRFWLTRVRICEFI